jgi:tRNA threonylcarbamoyl adenosine modification protein (Sua5/YciO/YrdC/YwlC family)
MGLVLRSSSTGTLEAAIAALQNGELIAIPTETVYGLAALPADGPIERLFAAKRRSADKGIQLLIDTLEQAEALAILTDSAARLAGAFWPGALTIVVRRREGVSLPDALSGGRATLGLRLPDHDIPRSLARRLGPIAASSANVSGQPDATSAERVDQSLGDVVSLIVDDGPVRGGTPSTVVDCSSEFAPPSILREGAIAAERITDALR